MVNYPKMYALLCGTIDDVLDELQAIPQAAAAAEKLQKALLDAEELFIETDEQE